MNTTRMKPVLAVVAVGILALAAMSVSVEAKPGDGKGEGKAAKQDREQRHERMKEMKEAAKEKCKDGADNATKERCDHLKHAVKARRAAHGLLQAIRVHERQLGRVEFQISQIEKELASGNFTGNHTQAGDEARLVKLNERHDKLVAKIEAEQAKLQKLQAKWLEVKDDLKDRREKGQDDGGVDDEADETAPAPATNTNTTSSSSSAAA